LGNIGRSKFYSDLLPELDVVKFGTRTFITLESLDRLITANCKLAVDADEEPNEPIRRHSPPERGCCPGGGGAVFRGADADGSRRVDDIFPSRGRAGRSAQVVGGPVIEPDSDTRRNARDTGTA
jgi:hypothetical protein